MDLWMMKKADHFFLTLQQTLVTRLFQVERQKILVVAVNVEARGDYQERYQSPMCVEFVLETALNVAL
jgi:hypothetical protein